MANIYVHNFGPIKDADIALNRLTLLIGEQASGKSTLAKLVYFFKSIKGMLLDWEWNGTGREFDLDTLQGFLKDQFQDYFGTVDAYSAEFRVEFYFSHEKYQHTSITFTGDPWKVEVTSKGWRDHLVSELAEHFSRLEKRRAERGIQGEESARLSLASNLKSLFEGDQVRYFPAGRNTYTGFPELVRDAFKEELRLRLSTQSNGSRHYLKSVDLLIARYYLSHVDRVKDGFRGYANLEDYMSFFPTDLKSLPSILSDRITNLLKGQYTHSQDGAEYFEVDGHLNVPVEHASTGQQETIRLVQDVLETLRFHKHVFRIIEEPEAHLFPGGQRSLMEILATLITHERRTPNHLLLTTHSPYILSIVNNLVYASMVPDKAATQSGFPSPIRIHRDWVSAYMLKNGVAKSIIDEETGLIGANLIEDAWEDIDASFQMLYALDD